MNKWMIIEGCYAYAPNVVDSIPAGLYTISRTRNDELCLIPKEIVSSDFISLPDTPQQYIFNSINTFLQKRSVFEQFKLVHKRGILLYGPPGSGKTTIIQQVSKQIVDNDGIVVFGDSPGRVAVMLNMIRKVEKNRQIVVLFEEIEAVVNNYGDHELLSLLDGELQINNVIFLATSNYPELLDNRLTNRPSRFDELIYVGMPSRNCRRSYITTKYPQISGNELDLWLEKTDNMSLAHIQELVIAVKCLDKDFDETIKRLKDYQSDKPNSSNFERSTSFGFISSNDQPRWAEVQPSLPRGTVTGI